MEILVKSLRRTPIFSHLNTSQIETLIRDTQLYSVEAGSIIKAPKDAVKHHLLVLDGNIKSQNKWLFYGNEMQYCWQLQSDESQCRFATLSSATRAINAKATSFTRYMIINGDEVENMQNAGHSASQNLPRKINHNEADLICLSA